MKDPVRLMEADGTEFERLLLSAAAREVPSSEVSARMLAGAASAGAAVALFSSIEAVGEGALSSSGGVQAAGAGAALGGAGGSIAPPAAASLLGTWLVKWGVIGALFSGAVVSGFLVVNQSAPAAESARAAAARQQVVAPVSPPTARGDIRAEGQPGDAAKSSIEAASVDTSVVARSPGPAQGSSSRHGSLAVPASTLGQEVALLDSARQALTAGDAERALSLISSYRRRFPEGALQQEATVLEVDALEAKGRAAQATDLKQQFLAEHPESAHTQRVQRSGKTR